ncbi:uncharacterized protein LOC106153808 isoform X1 [Lingula anatina]|uniref:Uncharacterized protein LOC106153808 isoform X1 n=1 Tax=Lingula anatina TaxID=7574 RepID=A0A1S3HBG2_LINAN|nr:uncharacterized protein LOC106153808 isoform X1 [Lingula anatina]|eukprot:XP_013383358.1 uncharacterized protein LOC106153808 isoform X1 [Lingula anatina]
MTRKRQEQLGRAPSAAELRNARLSKLTRSSPQEPSQLPQKDGKSDISQKNVRKRKHENQESSHKSPAALKQNYDDCDNDRADSEDAAVVGKTETEPLISTVTNAHTAKEDQQDISTAEMTGSVRSPALAVPKTKVKQKKQQQHGRVLSADELRNARLSKLNKPLLQEQEKKDVNEEQHYLHQGHLEDEQNVLEHVQDLSVNADIMVTSFTGQELTSHLSHTLSKNEQDTGTDKTDTGFMVSSVSADDTAKENQDAVSSAQTIVTPIAQGNSPDMSETIIEPESEEHTCLLSQSPEKQTQSKAIAQKAEEISESKSVKELPNETLVPLLLSDVLDIPVELQGEKSTPKSLSKLYLKNIPSSEAELSAVVCEVVQKRVRREHRDKVGLCVQCFDRCFEVQRPESLAKFILEAVKTGLACAILKELEIDFSDDDDFWSDVTTSDSISTVITQFLQGVSGCGGVAVPPALLELILTQAVQTPEGRKAIIQVLRVSGLQIKNSKRLDEAILQNSALLNGVEILMNQPLLVPILSVRLKEEIKAGKEHLGAYFERESVFGPLLSVSIIPTDVKDGLNLKAVQAQMFTSLPRFPKPFADDIQRVQSNIQAVLYKCQSAVYCGLKKMMKSCRNVALEWIATVINMNEMRLSSNPYQDNTDGSASCTDGFMQNLCAVLLEFCVPFFKDISKLEKIDSSYSHSAACLLNYDYETCLAGGQIVSEKTLDDDDTKNKSESSEEQFNFMTEVFHLTQRAMNIGSLPSLTHFIKLLGQIQRARAAKQGTPLEEQLQAQEAVYCWRWDSCIMDPEFIRKTSEFYITQAMWLDLLLQRCREKGNKAEVTMLEKRVFAQLPEYIVKDMAIWFSFVARQVVVLKPKVLIGLQLAPFVDCCVNLLQRPDLVPGPIPASKIVSALAAFMQTSNRGSRSVGWGNEVMSEMALMVCACEAVQHHLGPALLHTYVSVDVVEGLDVDKEDFDKYSARADIGKLMEFLWNRRDSRISVLNMCGTEEFQAFLGATLDTLLYQLHDSLARLANVRKLQIAKEDESTWDQLSWEQQQEKEKFLKSEEGVARGFMTMAKQTLGLITMLSQSEEVARCFTQKPMAQRAANAFIGFIEALCGSKSVEFKVKDMDKYSFNPRQLLSDVCQVLLRIAKEETFKTEGFVHSLAMDPDYSPTAWAKTYTVLSEKGVGDDQMVEEFGELLTQIDKLREVQVQEVEGRAEDQKRAWDTILAPLDIPSIEEEYHNRMVDLKYGTADIQESHSFRTSAGQSHDPRSQKWKALMKEIKQLQKDLPVHLNAAIFARQDENQMDIVRAVITGPADTPYSRGCFVFDIYFPTNYPHIPPLVKLVTTGNGTVRFNPNLYADGKVCLSLLGTWHGGDASEKWNPKTSSLYQVLVSIQGMILIEDPMFNEPGYDGIRGTEEGESRSAQYNSKIRLYTIRHAMLGQLRKPPPGSEIVIRRHFYLQRQMILKQCHDWLEISEESEKGRLHLAVEELRTELEKLAEDPNIFDEKDEESED